MGVAPLTVAQFASWLNINYDWRTAMLIIGIGASAVLIPAALFVRQPPSGRTDRRASARADTAATMCR